MVEKMVCDLLYVAVAFGLNYLKLDCAANAFAGNRACTCIIYIFAFFCFAFFIDGVKTVIYFFFYVFTDYFFFK